MKRARVQPVQFCLYLSMFKNFLFTDKKATVEKFIIFK